MALPRLARKRNDRPLQISRTSPQKKSISEATRTAGAATARPRCWLTQSARHLANAMAMMYING
eukprot:519226-Pyramimonas_sp.AAC.1